jgi:hypothetical protein
MGFLNFYVNYDDIDPVSPSTSARCGTRFALWSAPPFAHRARHAAGEFPVNLCTRHGCEPALRQIFVADAFGGSCDP